MIVIKGYSTPEVEQAYSRALELCQQLGTSPQLFPSLYGLTAFSVVRGELQTAYALSKKLLSLAYNASDPAFLVMAHRALGTTLLCRGEFVSARAHFERGLAVYDP